MNLLLQRDQRRPFRQAITYILQVTIVCNAQELAIIREHGLLNNQLFVVPEQQVHRDAVDAAFERADSRPVFHSASAAKMFADHFSAAVHAIRARHCLSVSVADALDGTTIECPNLHELIACEYQISTAFDELYRDVANALAFSLAREQVLEPDDVEEPEGPPPADWANRQRWRLF